MDAYRGRIGFIVPFASHLITPTPPPAIDVQAQIDGDRKEVGQNHVQMVRQTVLVESLRCVSGFDGGLFRSIGRVGRNRRCIHGSTQGPAQMSDGTRGQHPLFGPIVRFGKLRPHVVKDGLHVGAHRV